MDNHATLNFRVDGDDKCTIEEKIEANCLSYKWTRDIECGYNYSLGHTSEYLVRTFAKGSMNGSVEYDKSALIIMEKYDCTLDKWTGPLVANDYCRLHPEFIQILLDIMHALIYCFNTPPFRHGGLSRNNVFICQGRAKLGFIAGEGFQGLGLRRDCIGIVKLIEEMFNKKVHKFQDMPDMHHFLTCLPKMTMVKDLEYFLHHPVLLSPNQRCTFRLNAFRNEKFYENTVQNVLGGIVSSYLSRNNCQYMRNWKSRIDVNSDLCRLICYKDLNSNSTDFLKLNRHAAEHINDDIVGGYYDDVILDELLTNVWPGFLALWFEACAETYMYLPFLSRDLWMEIE